MGNQLDEKYFKKPNEFIPERWIKTNSDCYEKLSNQFAYLPFGFGASKYINYVIEKINSNNNLIQ